MKHVAIDLGGRESQICIRESTGTIVEERRYQTRLIPRLMKHWEPSRVIIETSAEAFAIADAAVAVGHEVRVVPATLVKTLGVVGAMRAQSEGLVRIGLKKPREKLALG